MMGSYRSNPDKKIIVDEQDDPKHVDEIKKLIKEKNIGCVITNVQLRNEILEQLQYNINEIDLKNYY